MTTGTIIFGVIALIAVAAVLEAKLKSGKHRALRPPSKVDTDRKPKLGMEATDTSVVDQAHAENQKIERRNWKWSNRRR